MVEKFEELLPCAVALGCAEAWQQRFDKVLSAANYAPEWVGGDYRSCNERDGWTDRCSSTLASVTTGAVGLAAAVEAAGEADAAARRTGSGGDDDSDSSDGGSVGGW
jgi:hypothetical protein